MNLCRDLQASRVVEIVSFHDTCPRNSSLAWLFILE